MQASGNVPFDRRASIRIPPGPTYFIGVRAGQEHLVVGERILVGPLPIGARILGVELTAERATCVHVGFGPVVIEVTLPEGDRLTSLDFDVGDGKVRAMFDRSGQVEEVTRPLVN